MPRTRNAPGATGRARRLVVPGIPADAARVLDDAIGELREQVAALYRKTGRPGIVSSSTSAAPGEFLNIEAPAAGLTVILPMPEPRLRNERITLAFRNTNPVRIVAIDGSVNRESFVVNTAVGTFDAVCDGLGGWEVETGLSSSGSSVDANYVLGSAHSSLPNAAVGTDTQEINFVFIPAGIATWILNTASVAFSKLQDLTGLSVLGRASASAGVMAAITASAARQTLRANDAGTALEWGHPVEVRDSGSDQGDAYALDFVAGTNINLAASVTGGVATITPSVDLSSVTYTAGDGLNLAANEFSVDVSDFAGTGLEDDGSNNLRIAAAAAGAGLTGGGGSALAVGAGTGITVSADAVSWSGVPIFQNATPRSPNALTFTFQDGTHTTAGAATDGSGNAFVTFNWSGFDSDENSSGGSGQAHGWRGLDFIDSTFISWSNSAPGDAFLGVSLELDDDALATQFAGAGLTASGGVMAVGAGSGIAVTANDVALAPIDARSVLANVTNSSAVPSAVQSSAARQVLASNSSGTGVGFRAFEYDDLPAIGNNRILVNVSGSSAPPASPTIASLLGGGLEFNSTSQVIEANVGERHIYVDSSSGELGFRKSRQRHFWFEDFDIGMSGGGAYSAAAGTTVHCPAGDTSWLLSASGNAATLEPQTPANNHIGIWRLSSGSASLNIGTLHRGFNEMRFDEVLAIEAVLRVPTVTSIGWDFGASDGASTSNSMLFLFDTTSFGTTVHTRTAEASSSTTNDTGVTLSANAWNVYTILQESPGTVEFYIDDVLEATHTTNVPDSETGGVEALVYPRSNSARTIDLDYVSFESQPLGARTS